MKVKIEKVISSVTIDKLAVVGSIDFNTPRNYISLVIRFIPEELLRYVQAPYLYVNKLVVRDVCEPEPIILKNVRLVLISEEWDIGEDYSSVFTFQVIEINK